MEEHQSSKYIEKIVLEILDRRSFWSHRWRGRRMAKFNFGKFDPNEAAFAFLRQYDGHIFVKAQKFTVWCKNQELHLSVRDLVYGRLINTLSRTGSTMVEFTYQKTIFSEIKWPTVAVNRTSRVRWANDYNEVLPIVVPENSPVTSNDEVYASINADQSINSNSRIVPCVLCHTLNNDDPSSEDPENATNSLCRDCRARRSVDDLQQLIATSQDVTEKPPVDNENHFRTSMYIHVNPICYQ